MEELITNLFESEIFKSKLNDYLKEHLSIQIDGDTNCAGTNFVDVSIYLDDEQISNSSTDF